ncbi:MAG TPA: RNA polymerase Rpb4 [Nitrososphaeraceae archaeon]|nr:RNA polymerase Rpb4 [Nitrososphaeraceae archaeon]HXV87830.1 RNA polymerase Rpb4 [Nitrososphaeraceae archaeon]
MTKITKKEMIALPDVKEILEAKKVDEMDQIQRWTYDYVNKFSKIGRKQAQKLVTELVTECGLTEEEAVEVVNILPSSLEEIRAFTFGWKKLILTSTSESILQKIAAVHEA